MFFGLTLLASSSIGQIGWTASVLESSGFLKTIIFPIHSSFFTDKKWITKDPELSKVEK